ncbi:hypothetical protein JAAARDRAFT_37815 [Jaapia argillacea MUCL 33604]|uniref:Uncharacterized protein n=1 Tax=Jaapia argillacea MUCL 33604 TaxID=933084 RepID=A0A067PY63_9AGAM|nr:hypothetical protein JAAARDRAFT_37815 [Jaapia argillacea MUCL 33604]
MFQSTSYRRVPQPTSSHSPSLSTAQISSYSHPHSPSSPSNCAPSWIPSKLFYSLSYQFRSRMSWGTGSYIGECIGDSIRLGCLDSNHFRRNHPTNHPPTPPIIPPLHFITSKNPNPTILAPPPIFPRNLHNPDDTPSHDL